MPRLTIERLAACILFILLFAMAVRVPLDTDTWWHLRSGQITLDDGSILREDRFSFTKRGEDWINHSWASQIVLYGAYKLTGGAGNPADTGTIGLAIYTSILATAGMGLIYRMCAGSVYSRMFILVIGAATAAVFWSARPQMFSFFFSALTLYLLYLYKYKNLDRLWAIPVLMALWANFHAGFAIGFIFLFGFLAGEAWGRWIDPGDENALSWQQLRKLTIVTLLGLVALSINPFGPKMILYAFQTAGLQTLNLFIQEWRSPDFKSPPTWPFILMLGTIIVLGSRTQKRLAWSDLFLVAGSAALALWSARNIAMFAVVATPVLSRQLDAWLSEHGWQIQPAQNLSPRLLRLNWIVLGIILLAALAQIGNTLSSKNVHKLHEKFLPVEAAAYLRQNPDVGALFNDYNWGGYFIFALPEVPVFVDGRTDLYGDDFLKDYTRAILGGKEWHDPLEKYAVQTVVIPEETALATLLRDQPDEWTIVYQDDIALIFERQAQP